MSDAVATTGILVRRGDGAGPEVFTTIGEIVTVTPPGFSRNKLESSTHNDGTESYVLGILRQKDPAFRINFLGDNVSHQNVLADILGNVKHNWEVVFPSGAVFSGSARVQRFEFVDAPVDAIQQVDVGLTWAGPVAFDAGA